jgi:F-type H+-transporting ATPase subunit beta
MVPVGNKTLGRIMDVLGRPIDEWADRRRENDVDPRQAAAFDELPARSCSNASGDRSIRSPRQGRPGGAGVGKTVNVAHQNIATAHWTFRCSGAR